MMDISVGVDIMEGLVMEINKKKGSPPLGNCPVTAVISCKKNVSNSRQISTHVPSLPLSVPSASFSDKVHNFLVRWPADFDPHGDALSTFKMSRLMKKDTTQSEGLRLTSGFVAEEIELSIGLLRGKEMLVVGKTILIITGNETEEMVIDLPISNEKDIVKNNNRDASPSPLKRTNSKLFSKSTKDTVKVLKPLSFPSDKRRKFHLTDNAMVRLHVQICHRADNNSNDEFGVQRSVSNTASYQDTGVSSSGSYSYKRSKETAFTEYSSYSGELTSSSKDESLESTDSYTAQNQSYANKYPVQPHKYHPHIPMDELQEDFGRVRLTNEMKNRIKTNASYGMTPPHVPASTMARSHSTGGASGNETPRYTQQHVQAPQMLARPSNKTRSSTGRAPGNEMPRYTQQDIQVSQMIPARSSSKTRSSSTGRAFGNEMSRYTQQDMQAPQLIPATRSSSKARPSVRHSSGTPRSSTPQRNKASHTKSHDGYYQPTSASRSRDYDHRQPRKNYYAPQTNSNPPNPPNPNSYGSYGEFVPRGSYDYHMQESENVRPYHMEGRQQSTVPKQRQSQSRSGDNGDATESPMTWLYDKFVGSKASAEETVSTTKKSNAKKASSSNEYRRPTQKRTMRV